MIKRVTDSICSVFFFNDTATTEIYTLSLHDALPISGVARPGHREPPGPLRQPPQRERRHHRAARPRFGATHPGDRKSTRLNSSHANISYAVFCLKKKHISLLLLSLLVTHPTSHGVTY